MAENNAAISFQSDAGLVRSLAGIPKLNILSALQEAAKAGKLPGAIARDIWRLKGGPGKLHPNEYFYYGLYGDGLSDDDKQRFVGKSLQMKIHVKCNDVKWQVVADNKQLFYALMNGYGFAVPETKAVFRATKAGAPGTTLQTREQLTAFLKNPLSYPIFAKPVDGIFSVGTFNIVSFDAGDDTLVLRSGDRISLEQCVDYMLGITEAGYLFQSPLLPHQELQAAFGTSTLATIRFLVALRDDEPELISTVCKIPAQGNMADNFWRKGNMLGAITPEDGALSRVVSGSGFETTEHSDHPDTGHPLLGMVLPDWDKAKALCLSAGATLPGIRTQSWDIALTASGPTVIEVNWGGDLNLHQLAHRRGILQDNYLSHLRNCGYTIKL